MTFQKLRRAVSSCRLILILLVLLQGCSTVEMDDPFAGTAVPTQGVGGNIDEDGDGLLLEDESFLGTNDMNIDSDLDGLRDDFEALVLFTNPANPDSDDDDLSDFAEVFEFKTDPWSGDTDSDRLDDGDEVLVFGTNPVRKDSDFDGQTDFDEIYVFQTSPTEFDTDSDGLSDGWEWAAGTDPNRNDTDYDGIGDADEIFGFTDPLDPSDPASPIVSGDLFSFLTQEQTNVFERMVTASSTEAAGEIATCKAQVQTNAGANGTLGGGSTQGALCGCERIGIEMAAAGFEDSLYDLLDQIDYTMTGNDLREVSAYMHRRYDRQDSCVTFNCTWASTICGW